jgi:hypothetical protein
MVYYLEKPTFLGIALLCHLSLKKFSTRKSSGFNQGFYIIFHIYLLDEGIELKKT